VQDDSAPFDVAPRTTRGRAFRLGHPPREHSGRRAGRRAWAGELVSSGIDHRTPAGVDRGRGEDVRRARRRVAQTNVKRTRATPRLAAARPSTSAPRQQQERWHRGSCRSDRIARLNILGSGRATRASSSPARLAPDDVAARHCGAVGRLAVVESSLDMVAQRQAHYQRVDQAFRT
jgi:hypothetical protein